MNALIAAIFVWGLVLWMFMRRRFGPPLGRWARAVAFKPKEPMSPEQLFGCLLSANFALLTRDNFNQLASALPLRRVTSLLREHWGIEDASGCVGVIDDRIERIGQMSASEKHAIAAWLAGSQVDSNEFAALEDTCRFMSLRARITSELQHGHLSVLAWDIQQLAYLLRLAYSAGHISRDETESALERLKQRARSHYASWEDYSLSSLVGLGMRGSLEIFDEVEWTQFARTHSVLVGQPRSPVRHAAAWNGVGKPREARCASAPELLPA